MKVVYCLCLFFGFNLLANGQNTLTGVVLNESGQPLPNAAVFINSTCIETTTNSSGNFVLKIPAGRSVFIVASQGFQTYSQVIDAKQLPQLLTVKMQKKAPEKTGYERHGWSDWGNFFITNFVGSSTNARQCKIKNTEALRFYLLKETNELSVSTNEPLIIENKSLGYTIKYYLESFVFNFGTQMFSYNGRCFYQPMVGSTVKQKAWEDSRSEAYFGSMMHFLRSVYHNRLAEEGFDVRPLKKIKSIPSYEKSSTDSAKASTSAADSSKATVASGAEEDYRDQIVNEDNYRDLIGAAIPGDSIAYAINETTAGLYFNNFLMVTYLKKDPPKEYQEQMNGSSMTSELILINRRPIEIEWNGTYYDTTDLLVLGYWTWAQKMANSLPFDYIPPKGL
jgi:hypothetical protein